MTRGHVGTRYSHQWRATFQIQARKEIPAGPIRRAESWSLTYRKTVLSKKHRKNQSHAHIFCDAAHEADAGEEVIGGVGSELAAKLVARLMLGFAVQQSQTAPCAGKKAMSVVQPVLRYREPAEKYIQVFL